MGSVFDYINWRGDLSLKQSPFNAVDNVILTHLSYLSLDNIVPGPDPKPHGEKKSQKELPGIREAAKAFASSSEKRKVIFREDPALLEALGNSQRYGSMKLAGFVNQIDPVQEKQFAALTILTGDDCVFISYRGTDDSLVGWKEDFNMVINDEVPAQGEAIRYLEITARQFKMPLRIGGHSKGGNLGVYAASFCSKETQKRITEIYTNDAPGFTNNVLDSEGYKAIKDKIHSFVPEGSVIGMLFEHDNNHTVVKSSKIGLFQHDIYSWEVMGKDLISLEDITRGSRFIDSTIKEWMNALDRKQRQEFIEALFSVIYSTEANSFFEIGTDWLKNSLAMLQSISSIDNHTRRMLVKTLRVFFKAARNNVRTLFPQYKIKTGGLNHD